MLPRIYAPRLQAPPFGYSLHHSLTICLQLTPHSNDTILALPQCDGGARALSPSVTGGDATKNHDEPQVTDEARALLQRRLRILGAVLLAWGLIHFVGYPALSLAWGAILVLAGAASFVFSEASLFLVYSVMLLWAALANLLTGQALGIINAVVQVFLAISSLRNYRAALRAEAGAESVPEGGRAGCVFPWASLALGLASIGGSLALLLAGYLVLGFTASPGLPIGYEPLFQAVANLGSLGLGAGVAALVSGYPRRGLAVVGVAASALVLLSQIASAVLFLLFS
jgi:hypothetical protein